MKTKAAILSSISVVLGLLFGFVVGGWLRPRAETTTATRIERRPAVSVSLDRPAPIAVREVAIPALRLRDTIYAATAIDTASIVADFCRARDYRLDFSTDSTGTFIVDATVAYNALQSATATIEPLRQVIETTTTIPQREPLFAPYVTLGTSVDFATQQITLGAQIRGGVMLGISGVRHNNQYGYTINIGYKF